MLDGSKDAQKDLHQVKDLQDNFTESLRRSLRYDAFSLFHWFQKRFLQ